MARIGADVIRDKYTGRVAEVYDQRSRSPKWRAEDAAMERFLDRIGPVATVLDIPVGTGRFLATFAARGIAAIGMDVSADMMAQARLKAPDADLRHGDILAIDMADQSVDLVVAMRIMSWLTVREMRTALAEIGRVSRRWVITGGGREDARRGPQRAVPGYVVRDEALIDRDARGDYDLVLLERDPCGA
jgi:ubiquinone/menaquinone biosynthesis C-methylase UbiE